VRVNAWHGVLHVTCAFRLLRVHTAWPFAGKEFLGAFFVTTFLVSVLFIVSGNRCSPSVDSDILFQLFQVRH
jgi:hypothetical protein